MLISSSGLRSKISRRAGKVPSAIRFVLEIETERLGRTKFD